MIFHYVIKLILIMENKKNSPNTNSLKSPDEVAHLLKNLWLCHKAGLKKPKCLAYMVELPPPTEEELKENRNLED